MQNTTTTVIAICLAATLLFVAPLVSLTERNDNVVQENVELLVNEFVTDVQNTGIISQAKYQSLENSLAATGNTYNVEMEVQHLDENPGKKTTGEISLKEGDRIVVNVKNTNTTQAQTLKGSLLSFTNAGQYTIAASSTGMIKVNGK